MKKLILGLILLTGIAYAEQNEFRGSSTSTIVIERPGSGKQNCLTNLSWSVGNHTGFNSTSTYLAVIDGSVSSGTTIYSLYFSTGQIVSLWPQSNPLCTTSNSSTTISGLGLRMNYNGFVR